jgi:hypothetical protein
LVKSAGKTRYNGLDRFSFEEAAMEKSELAKELKALGSELSDAFKQIRSSREFKDIEKEVSSALRGLSSTVAKGLKAAKNSDHAGKLTRRLKRVVKAGSVQGKHEAGRAKQAAAVGIRKVRVAVRDLKQRLRSSKKNGA